MHLLKNQNLISHLKTDFYNCDDVIFSSRIYKHFSIELSYITSLVDVNFIEQVVLPKFRTVEGSMRDFTFFVRDEFLVKDVSESSHSDLQMELLSGSLLIFIGNTIYALNVLKIPSRTPEESSIEPSVQGPRDGFIEDLHSNLALIRKRFKSNQLKVEKYIIGKRSNVTIALIYIDDIINKPLLDSIKDKICNLDIDVVTSLQQIEKLLADQPRSIMTTSDNSGRPDYVLEALNQGRYALMIDGQPLVSIAPVHLANLIKSPEDLNQNYLYVSFQRMLRLSSLFISILLPGFWVALTTHNIDQIPFQLVATISVSRIGIPLSTFMEMVIMLFLFELFHEAGMRLPRSVGQTVSVLGGLIVGDAAIRSGLTSPSMLVVGGIVFVSGYTLVNPTLGGAATLLRIIILILGAFFGIFGIVVGTLLVISYFSTLTSHGVPYLSFAYPFSITKLGVSFFKMPLNMLTRRDASLRPNDPNRQED
jgi:hypothetical protein